MIPVLWVSKLAISSTNGIFVLATTGSQDGPVELDSCQPIEQPGQYVVTDDIEDSQADSCLTIRSSDVHLDGNGHTIDGVNGEDTAGVDLQPTGGELRNVTITGLTVIDWATGIGQPGGLTPPEMNRGSIIETRIGDTTVWSNRDGISLVEARKAR